MHANQYVSPYLKTLFFLLVIFYLHTKGKSMEALWSLEEKLKLTTQEAVLVFVCTASAVIGLCAATVLKKKARKKQMTVEHRDAVSDSPVNAKCIWFDQPSCNWVSAKKVLMSSVMWSGATRWGERSFGWEERPPPLLRLEEYDSSVGWRSHNSDSPVWQRPILMGEKCQLPRFSGLILYDERGQLLDRSINGSSEQENNLQEKSTAKLRTTLRDLL